MGKACAEVSKGSPPHGRGKVVYIGPNIPGVGITPAWAGKRSARLLWRLTIGDHPRMGEEKVAHFSTVSVVIGSPPHGRGKVVCCGCLSSVKGITPA